MHAHDIREDVLRTHLSMNLMRTDAEARRRQRFADYGPLDDEKCRARLLWKSRPRLVKPAKALPDMDWRSTQTVWPHHTLRGDDWVVVPAESQPKTPRRHLSIAAGGSAPRHGSCLALRRDVAIVRQSQHLRKDQISSTATQRRVAEIADMAEGFRADAKSSATGASVVRQPLAAPAE
jgi:hypothetical protein